MASSDYRLCDVCDGKAFYDANIDYDHGDKDDGFRVAGKPQPWGLKLGYVGDWAVICTDCAKTHRTAILPLGDAA